MAADEIGAMIDGGIADWQIVQQNAQGYGEFVVSGHWAGDPAAPASGSVHVRVVYEANGVPVSAKLDWHVAPTADDGTWQAALAVPAGGLYRIETRYVPAGTVTTEWSIRGDVRHFVGVGDLWVIAGQSNSSGYGRGPVEDPPTLGVHLLRNNEQWALAAHPLNESNDTRHPANRETLHPGHSPYLQVGRRLQSTLGYPIGLLQTALGGSFLSSWNPAEPGPSPLFDNMMHCIKLAGGRVRGIMWYQGESDTLDAEHAESYAERFSAAVAAWRAATDDPALPIITVQLNRAIEAADPAGDRHWTIVRDAQRRVADLVDGIAVVPALDLPLSDFIHTSAAGNIMLAERMALAALATVYGRPVEHRAPNVQTVELQGEDIIVLHFADVGSRIGSIDLAANPFRVEDGQGVVEIAAVIYPGDSTVQLHLARPIGGAAHVHGGYGKSPQTMPLDMARSLPLLAFWAVPAYKRAVSSQYTNAGITLSRPASTALQGGL